MTRGNGPDGGFSVPGEGQVRGLDPHSPCVPEFLVGHAVTEEARSRVGTAASDRPIPAVET